MDNNTKLRELQLFECSILNVIVSICEKNGIKYYLSSGTLLGAIRHKGFIPWDDDIDIDMPIKDYNRFCKIAPRELEEKGLFLQTYKTVPQYQHMWAKVNANYTTCMPRAEAALDIHWGVYVDIFPMIGLYDNTKLRRIQQYLFDLNRMILERDYYELFLTRKYKPGKVIRILYSLPHVMRRTLVNLNNVFVDRDFMHGASGACKFICLEPRNKEYYGEGVLVEFEGRRYNAPRNYDMVLKSLYGDYMELPPIDKRGGHELGLGEIIVDLERDFKEFRNELIQ